MSNPNNYKGFDMFNDVSDKALKLRNRAVVLANISADNMREQKISPKGALLVLGYFSCIPSEERAAVRDQYIKEMETRGFTIA